MAKPKQKAGSKKVKKATRAASAPAPVVQKVAERGDPPKLVHVKKGSDVIPVQIGNWAQFDRLVSDHGSANVEVQS